MKRLLPVLVLLFVPLDLAAQSGILAPSRYIDWSKAGLPATLPDGETTPNPWTPPTRPACTSGQAGITVPVASGTAFSTIVTAMGACASANPTGSYLQLGSGSFTMPSATAIGVSNVTLRGNGPMNTTLNLNNTLDYGNFGGYGGGLLNASPGAGVSSVTITGAAGTVPVVGYLAWLNQCDTGYSGSPQPTSGYNTCPTGSVSDNGAVFVCGGNLACNTGGAGSGAGGQTSQFQYVRITSVTNNGGGSYTIGFSPSVYLPNWSTANTAAFYWMSAAVSGLGIEDMTIVTNSAGQIRMQNAYASWFKGNRFLGRSFSGNLVLQLGQQIANSLVSNNYFFGSNPSSMTANGIIITPWEDSATLVLNNIAEQGLFLEGHGSSSGSVIAYNYSKNVSTNYVQATDYQHDNANSGVSFVLNEGNQTNEIIDDDTWGTGDLNTFFRNWVSCSEEPYVYSSGNGIGIGISSFHRFDNAVANVLAGGNECTGYSGTSFYNWFWINGPGTDTLTATSLMRWANYDAVNAAVRCQSSEVPTSLSGPAAPFSNSLPATPSVCGGSATIPASFYMSTTAHPSGGTGLSWWKVCTSGFNASTGACGGSSTTQPFPSTGPDVTGGSFASGFAYANPAQLAWQKLPIDTSLQNSYSITGSSWSGGIETLTVSGLPTGTQIMGPLQISGGACATSGAGTSTGAEVTMTGSTGTTISYALASNPGSCTGTMLWPDVRQFDERVYQTDSGTPQVATPTFSPSTLSAPGFVTISTATSGATCYYTVDGSAPATSSAIYQAPLYLAQSQTVRSMCAASGLSNSAITTQGYSFTTPKTRFSLMPRSATETVTPTPLDVRMEPFSGVRVSDIETSNGVYTWTKYDAWVTAAASHNWLVTFTYQARPAWMTGLAANTDGPSSDWNTVTSCGTVGGMVLGSTVDCMWKTFVIHHMMHVTGLSSVPASPVNCAHLDYLEAGNEVNTSSGSSSLVGWSGTPQSFVQTSNDAAAIKAQWCSNTQMELGSVSAIVGSNSTGNSQYDVFMGVLLGLVGSSNAGLYQGVSFHNYGARGTVIPVPPPTSVVSYSSSLCTSGNTPNNNCYVDQAHEVSTLRTNALQQPGTASWSANLPITSDEGGFGPISQLNGDNTFGSAYISELIPLVAAQNPVSEQLYLANDSPCGSTNWGCYGVAPFNTATSAVIGWENAATSVGACSTSSITGGTMWNCALNGGAEAIVWCAVQDPATCTTTTAFNTRQDINGNVTSTGGSLTLNSTAILLSNATYTLSVNATNGSISGVNCAQGPYANGTPIGPCTANPAAGYLFSSWSGGSCSGSTNPCPQFSLNSDATITANFGVGYTLSTAFAGNGTGTIINCAGTMLAGTPFGCTINPAAGSTLTSVTGCGGTGTSYYTGTMPASNCTVTATFTLLTPPVCTDPSQLGPNFSGSYVIPPATLPLAVGFGGSNCPLFYTSDGSTPTCTSAAYPTGGFSINGIGTFTYRVIACQSGYTTSNVIGGTWTTSNASNVSITLQGNITYK